MNILVLNGLKMILELSDKQAVNNEKNTLLSGLIIFIFKTRIIFYLFYYVMAMFLNM